MARIKPQALLQQSKKKKGPARISVITVVLYSLILFLLAFFLYTSGRYWYRRSKFHTDNEVSISEVGNGFADIRKHDVPEFAEIKTSKGSIIIELHKDSSPEVVDEFIDLCQKGHFKGKLFHRVIKHYVIHSGESKGLGVTEDWILRGKEYNRLHKSVKHEAFMLGTSKGKHDNIGFDLFITTAPIPDLNDKIIVFGQVIQGIDIVQEIEEVDTDEHYQPKNSIGILDVVLRQKV